MPKTAQTKVAGRNVSVTNAIVFIAAPSAWAARPSSTEMRASYCTTVLNASSISFTAAPYTSPSGAIGYEANYS